MNTQFNPARAKPYVQECSHVSQGSAKTNFDRQCAPCVASGEKLRIKMSYTTSYSRLSSMAATASRNRFIAHMALEHYEYFPLLQSSEESTTALDEATLCKALHASGTTSTTS